MSEEVKVKEIKVSNEVPFGDGRVIDLKPKIRSSLFARFREENPKTVEAITSVLTGTEGGFSARVTEVAMKGVPSTEVISMCAFLGEVTRDIRGFPEQYDWREMGDDARTDFFDLEVSDLEKLSCLVVVYAMTLGKV